MTDEQFKKLPKFARDEIKRLRQQRETAVAALKKWADEQTPSPISIMEMECLENGAPTHFTRYVQGQRIEINHDGVFLGILLRNGEIGLHWSGSKDGLDQVAFVPKSYQHASLISKQNMR